MRVLLVHCHPFERSFCAAISERLSESFDASTASLVYHDLYAESPDPVLSGAEIARRYSLEQSIQSYSNELIDADLVVAVHPDWWSGPPALLKGWIERVFRPGVAYDWQGEEFQEKHHVPLLTGKELWVFATTDKEPSDQPGAIEQFWRDLADYSGMLLTTFRLFSGMRKSGHRERRGWLKELDSFVTERVAEVPGETSGGADE